MPLTFIESKILILHGVPQIFFNSDSRFLIHLRKWAKLIKFEAKYEHFYRVIFLTGPPLKMSLDWPPQKPI